MGSQKIECTDARCDCDAHGGMARHLTYGVETPVRLRMPKEHDGTKAKGGTAAGRARYSGDFARLSLAQKAHRKRYQAKAAKDLERIREDS